MLIREPPVMRAAPCRPSRVGKQESKVSTPVLAAALMLISSPTPNKWTGFRVPGGSRPPSARRMGITVPRMPSSSAVSLPRLPPMANPSKGRPLMYSALQVLNSLLIPPWITPSIACWRRSARCVRNDLASHRCVSATLLTRSRAGVWKGGSSSSGMMISAPSCFWFNTDFSGLRSTSFPSLYDRKTTPASLTLIVPFGYLFLLLSLLLSSSVTEWFAKEKTWNPPESVMRG
mmetsp:Transcript_5737/g.19886  ORF Transcript_5737/g.19886 Transcript_5737/m.19886 type:complete len:232 (-) Transcript_5737:463-1158(-)